jgi:hypothetical protein
VLKDVHTPIIKKYFLQTRFVLEKSENVIDNSDTYMLRKETTLLIHKCKTVENINVSVKEREIGS